MTRKQQVVVCIIVVVLLIGAVLWWGYTHYGWGKKSPKYNVSKLKYTGKDRAFSDMCRQSTKRCKEPAGSHSCCVDHLATMLQDLNTEMGSKVFILYGTLLAWKRYGGKHMIPHDDDLDTGMFAKHEKTLKQAIPALEKKGYKIYLAEGASDELIPNPGKPSGELVKPPPYRYYVMEYSKTNALHLDIAILTQGTLPDGSQVFVDSTQEWADSLRTMSTDTLTEYENWIFPKETITPIVPTTYLGVKTYRPEHAVANLARVYGPDFMTPHKRDKYDNEANNPVMRLKKEIGWGDARSNEAIGMGPVYFIGLKGDVERRHHLLTQCDEEQLYTECGGNCCEEKLPPAVEARFEINPMWKRKLYPGAKKCFLSHEMCWEKVATQPNPCLIVEDDVSFPYGIREILAKIVADIRRGIKSGILPPATAVRLGFNYSSYSQRISHQLENTCLAKAEFNTGTWAYILTPEAAQTLLSVSYQDKLIWPADHFVNKPMVTQGHPKPIWETRLPPPNEYMFLEVIPDMFQPLKFRYELEIDNAGPRVIQELSTEYNMSRSEERNHTPEY